VSLAISNSYIRTPFLIGVSVASETITMLMQFTHPGFCGVHQVCARYTPCFPSSTHHRSALITAQHSSPLITHHRSALITALHSSPLCTYHRSALITAQHLSPLCTHHCSALDHCSALITAPHSLSLTRPQVLNQGWRVQPKVMLAECTAASDTSGRLPVHVCVSTGIGCVGNLHKKEERNEYGPWQRMWADGLGE
jgi:hypothetical protein